MNQLINNIRQWGIDKGITGPDGKGTVSGQIDKLREEYLEIVDAHLGKDFEGLLDGIGDCFVVLVLLAERAGTTIEECGELAYDVIKKRTGKMENGMFVKDVVSRAITDDDDIDWSDLDPSKACKLGDETCESCQ